MTLSFTSIPDQHGPAVYVFGNGTSQMEQRLIALGKEIDQLTAADIQVVYLDPNRGDGLRVKEFYALGNFPVVIIVMDDDTIYQKWEGSLPQADQVSYAVSQAGGGRI